MPKGDIYVYGIVGIDIPSGGVVKGNPHGMIDNLVKIPKDGERIHNTVEVSMKDEEE